VGLGKYIKQAFLFHWNLLAFGAGIALSVISGHPDVGLPLVLAAETAYLGFLGTHPRFQRHIDAQEHKTQRAEADALAVERLLKSLPPAQYRRFQSLRDRCLALRQIAQQLRAPGEADSMRSLEDLQLSDLDRLLWIYLRMLYTQNMLERFFERTSRQEIKNEIRRLEDRIARVQKDPDSPKRARMLQSLEANLATCNSRLSNLDKAQENYDLLQAEAENLEAKIQSITEMAINRSDAGAITGQVEEITQGLVRTEQTINELGFATGAESFDLTIPRILSRDEAPVADIAAEPPAARERRQDEIQFF
jgi:hypothetical protein